MNANDAEKISDLVAGQLDEFRRKHPGGIDAAAADKLFESITGYVKRNCVALSERIKALEDARAMAFEGAHDVSKTYRAGSVTQRQSKVWVALIQTDETPGASTHWRCLS